MTATRTPLPVVPELRFDLPRPDVADGGPDRRAPGRSGPRGHPRHPARRSALRLRDGGDAGRAPEQREQPPRPDARCRARPRESPRGRLASQLLRARRGRHHAGHGRRSPRSSDDDARAAPRPSRRSGSVVGGRHRRLARRLDPARASRRLAHDRRPRARHERGLRRRVRVLPLRPAQGPAAAGRRRHRS